MLFRGGGATKDNQKRQEIFFNELIANDEVRQMLSPKVLGSAKKYSKNGIEEINQFDENDNLIIKGNNLIALASLLKRYEGKVKCIYIDPPYNTGNDSFNYNDKFNHSSWLVFMKNRLELAKRLLRDDGVIFVQCDDNEQAYLKVLMDEIFGNKNFISSMPRRTSSIIRVLNDYEFQKIHDYILVYGKVKTLVKFKKEKTGEREFNMVDSFGEYLLTWLQNSGAEGTREARPNLYYPVYLQNDGSLELTKNKNTIDTVLPSNIGGKEGRWLWSKEKFEECKDRIVIIKGKLFQKRYKYEYDEIEKYQSYKTWLDNFPNAEGSKEVGDSIGKGRFSFPKSEKLLNFIIDISTSKNDIVLDFFLGSGTTAAVAHKINRRYIGIEQMDYIQDIAVERLKKVIDGEQGGISKSVNWQGGGSFVYCELLENSQKLINEVQKADESNIVQVKNKVFSDDKIIPYITTSELKQANNEFNILSLKDKKKILIKLIDKNKLYINYPTFPSLSIKQENIIM
ncbi:site-specific DNA-methyltransferase [Mycoplasmopsis bovis]|uniref:site-specific DNA-methyltransferase n=1 Tax=Mycoplasmopsis bovis TaxID=28903 RepID=UPI003D291BD0